MILRVNLKNSTGALNDKEKVSNDSLKKVYEYLKVQQAQGKLPCAMDLASFKNDLDNNIHFNSSIPQGFGVGSSGAVVAAVYGKYATEPILPEDAVNGDNFYCLKKDLRSIRELFPWKKQWIGSFNLLLKLTCPY